jgi:hypothetical protein
MVHPMYSSPHSLRGRHPEKERAEYVDDLIEGVTPTQTLKHTGAVS